MSCLVCGSKPVHAHHSGPRGLGQKSPDRHAVPLCWKHHDRNSDESIHTLGPAEFARRHPGVNFPATIAILNAVYDPEQEGFDALRARADSPQSAE